MMIDARMLPFSITPPLVSSHLNHSRRDDAAEIVRMVHVLLINPYSIVVLNRPDVTACMLFVICNSSLSSDGCYCYDCCIAIPYVLRSLASACLVHVISLCAQFLVSSLHAHSPYIFV
jgi:hypothetical protein